MSIAERPTIEFHSSLELEFLYATSLQPLEDRDSLWQLRAFPHWEEVTSNIRNSQLATQLLKLMTSLLSTPHRLDNGKCSSGGPHNSWPKRRERWQHCKSATVTSFHIFIFASEWVQSTWDYHPLQPALGHAFTWDLRVETHPLVGPSMDGTWLVTTKQDRSALRS